MSKITFSWLLLLVICVSSCVSSKKYKAATTSAQNAKTSFDSLSKKTNDLQSQLNDAISSSKMLTEERDRLQKEGEASKTSLGEMQSAVNDYNGSVDAVQKSVADKMADYANRGAEVTSKDGVVHVNLQDDLLYKKGSGKISKDGETALGTLSSVLSEHPDLKVLVIGHTDDRAGKGGDSWTVSTERANTIVRMLKNMKIDPSRLTSAGQGQYNAVGDNSTAEGRAQNRRTEILLSTAPFKLLNKDTK
jgi:chemotaxis protein MotB